MQVRSPPLRLAAMRLLMLPALLALSACSTFGAERPVLRATGSDWRAVATSADRVRLRDWRTAFTQALAKARAGGHAAAIEKEGALLQPDAASGGVPIPNGFYACRVIKLGAKQPGLLDYIAYPPFRCRIQQENGLQGFAKLTGSQRPVGLIFPGDALRQVFLGTLSLGDESGTMHYGRDAERDVAGYVEKLPDGRWRMILPYPAFESTLDVIELVPAS